MKYLAIRAAGKGNESSVIQYIRTDGNRAWCFATKGRGQSIRLLDSIFSQRSWDLDTYLKGCEIVEQYESDEEFLKQYFEVFL